RYKMKTRFIGDVHGKYSAYGKLIIDSPPSIQVGDMGVGFRRNDGSPRHGEYFANPPFDKMMAGNHRFIRGNHDNLRACRNQRLWIPDGHVENGMMFIGGGLSIDRQYRVENYSWWADEELSIKELYDLLNKYIEVKPKVMVTHDCPEEISIEILRKLTIPGINKLDFPSRTRQCFQSMWLSHSPDLWIFGHWHVPFDHVLRGTRFICLPELGHIDLDIS
ncbi:MAG TPA: metallophosphoesterase, partial [Methylomirabilota bacterium]|nr:metallophosphoesterase [Methylomirabilota bacterium]